jgi:hypothetical protein
VSHTRGSRDLDIMGRQTAVFHIDPKPIEVPRHPQVVDDVVVEHPSNGKHHQPLATLKAMLHELGHVISSARERPGP